jgi:acyl carrier protein
MDYVQEAINQVLEQTLGTTLVGKPPSSILADDLGLDSTEMVDVEVGIEQKLGVRVRAGVLSNAMTLAEIYVAVRAELAFAGAGRAADTELASAVR